MEIIWNYGYTLVHCMLSKRHQILSLLDTIIPVRGVFFVFLKIFKLFCKVRDDAEVEDIQIVLDYFADRLMNLDDEVQSILEF